MSDKYKAEDHAGVEVNSGIGAEVGAISSAEAAAAAVEEAAAAEAMGAAVAEDHNIISQSEGVDESIIPPMDDPPPHDDEDEEYAEDSAADEEPKAKRARTSSNSTPLGVAGDAQWNAMLFQLIYYKAVHGDLRPKAKDEENKPLYDWMVTQRKEFKVFQETPDKSFLHPDQVKVLDHLQFPWNTRGDEHWHRNYEHLKQFRLEHGHCMVPRTFVDVPNLCHWVTDQRRQLKNLKSNKPSTMTKERQRLLDEIKFVWQVRNRTTWDTRFAELAEFKDQKGTTVVPQHYSANKALGKWVAKQREQYKLLKKGEHSFLTPDRLEQLDSLGFVWSMKGRTPRDDDDDEEIEDAAVAAAKAAVAAAVAAEHAHDEELKREEEHHHLEEAHHLSEDQAEMAVETV